MNLTAVRDPDEAWQRHVGDSLALLPVIERHVASSLAAPLPSSASSSPARRAPAAPRSQKAEDRPQEHSEPSSRGRTGDLPEAHLDSLQSLSIIDVGTGAGLPGMVLAAARPLWKVNADLRVVAWWGVGFGDVWIG